MKSPRIHLDRLTKKFGAFTAVDNVDLTVSSGEIYGFLGPNGAGKTTTIKMIAGLLQPSSGSISIGGKQLADDPAYCKNLTGYIPDRPYLYEKLTGTEYLGFIASLYNTLDANPRSEADYYLEIFDLTDWKDHLIEGYSHGMRQKLIMTSIFMLNQPIIVVDEPMVGLDPKSARIVKELFKTKAQAGIAIFLSTHSMEIAEELCDRIGIIVQGKLKAEGNIAELRGSNSQKNSNLEQIFLELTGAFELQNVIKALQSDSKGSGASHSSKVE